MRTNRTMEKLLLWTLYLKTDKQLIFVTRNYWECRIDEIIARNRLIDKRAGITNNYIKVLETNSGHLADESDLKHFE